MTKLSFIFIRLCFFVCISAVGGLFAVHWPPLEELRLRAENCPVASDFFSSLTWPGKGRVRSRFRCGWEHV